MTTFPFDQRKPIILNPGAGGPLGREAIPGPFSGPIVFRHRTRLLAIPTQPVGDPVPRPGTPQPAPQRDPSEPVHAPNPREPELPAIEPHEPGLPDTRIEDLYEARRIGDPHSSSAQCWLIR